MNVKQNKQKYNNDFAAIYRGGIIFVHHSHAHVDTKRYSKSETENPQNPVCNEHAR